MFYTSETFPIMGWRFTILLLIQATQMLVLALLYSAYTSPPFPIYKNSFLFLSSSVFSFHTRKEGEHGMYIMKPHALQGV